MAEIIISNQRYKKIKIFFFFMKLKSLEKSQWIGWNASNLKLQSRKLGIARKPNYLFPLASSRVAKSVGIQNLVFSEGEDKAIKAEIQNYIWHLPRLYNYFLYSPHVEENRKLNSSGSWNWVEIYLVGRIFYRASYLSPTTAFFCYRWKRDIRWTDEFRHGSRVIKLLWVRHYDTNVS